MNFDMLKNLTAHPFVLAAFLLAGMAFLDNRDALLLAKMDGIHARLDTIEMQVQQNGRDIRGNRGLILENSQQIAVLTERINRLHPELSAKR